jgi:hypothetical protein|tara:strand:- start:3698 stop:3817 length:120 start_codon:yes stop_codon:yes gene_type:complete
LGSIGYSAPLDLPMKVLKPQDVLPPRRSGDASAADELAS